jgi:hypothetical protein
MALSSSQSLPASVNPGIIEIGPSRHIPHDAQTIDHDQGSILAQLNHELGILSYLLSDEIFAKVMLISVINSEHIC